MRRVARALAATAAVSITCLGNAAEIRAAGELAVGHSDNIVRTSTNELSETIASAGFDLTYTERTARLAAELISSLDYQHYVDGSYDDELIGFLTGSAVAELVPDRLRWTAQDNFGQTRLDLFSTPTPDNRENINYFTTGPDLILSPFASLELRLAGRYSDVDYEIRPNDNTRVAGMATLARVINPNSEASLNVQSQSTRFNRQFAFADYRLQQAYAEYSVDGARTSLLVNAGRSQLRRGGVSESGSLLRVVVDRQLARRASLTLRLGRDISDSAEALRFQQTLDYTGAETLSLGLPGSPFEQRLGSLALNVAGARTQIGLSYTRTEENYVGAASQDRKRGVADIRATRTLGPQLSINGSLSHTTDQYVSAAGDLTEQLARVGMNWQVRRRMALELLGERYERQAAIARAAATETRVWLRLRFGDPGAGQRPTTAVVPGGTASP